MDRSSISRLIGELLPAIGARGTSRAARIETRLDQLAATIAAARLAKLDRVKEKIGATLMRLDEAVATRQRRHAATSPDLNCWAVLGLEHSELQHSLVLAWLLDPRASHAQGGLFLSELLRAVQPKVPLPPSCADEIYRVATEVRHSRSRIDIEIIGRTFLIHVEAKVNADEGDDQTCRERDDLKAKASKKGIPLDRAWGMYLTVSGDACADQDKFRPVSWLVVVSSIEEACAMIRSRHPHNVYLPWVIEAYTTVVRAHVIRERLLSTEVTEWVESSSTMLID